MSDKNLEAYLHGLKDGADERDRVLQFYSNVPCEDVHREFPKQPAERYFLSMDSSFHWYIVPVSRCLEWETWTALDDDDEAGWEVPDYARRIGGAVSRVTFLDPKDGE